MEENVLVSVIIPTYNQTELFKRAVQSVFDQTYSNLEVIVVDDNNDPKISEYIHDFLGELTKEYRNVRYIKNKKNSGSAYSRNVGIKKSNGEYITFLDDDDYYEKNKIQFQLKQMVLEQANYSVCNIALTKDNQNFKIRKRNFLSYSEPLLTKHVKYHIAATSTFMFKTSFLKQIGGFTARDYGDDYYLMEKAIKKSNNFSHINYLGVVATLNSTQGLSSWEKKISTEKMLLEHKLSQTLELSIRDRLYIEMRHHAVIAYAYANGGKILKSIVNLVISIILHPFGFVKLFFEIDF